MQPIRAVMPITVVPGMGLTDHQLQLLLEAVLSPAGLILAGTDHMHLYKNNFTPGKNNVLADFSEVLVGDLPGYAPQALPLTIEGRDVDGNWEADTSPLQWIVTGAALASALTVYGFFITDAANAVLKAWYKFPTPVVLLNVGDQVVTSAGAKVFE